MELLLVVPVLVFSVVVHEVAHAWQAWREGDSTARDLGRITLNPLPHLDLVGSFLVPLVLYLLPGGILFGWAKPVPVNPANFRDYRGGDIRVSLAGIAANVGLAGLCAVGWLVLSPLMGALGGGQAGPAGSFVLTALLYGIFINVLLACINLVPAPPLDGSRVLRHFLPRSAHAPYERFGRYAALGLLLVVVVVPGAADVLVAPARLAVSWVVGLGIG